MENFAGKYENVKSENYAEYLVALGVVKDISQAPSNAKSTLDFSVNGNKLVITSSAHSYAPTLVLNEEVDDKTTDGTVVKSLLKIDGNNLTVETTLPQGVVAKRSYTLLGSDLTLKLTTTKAGVPEATINYKKL